MIAEKREGEECVLAQQLIALSDLFNQLVAVLPQRLFILEHMPGEINWGACTVLRSKDSVGLVTQCTPHDSHATAEGRRADRSNLTAGASWEHPPAPESFPLPSRLPSPVQ